MDLDLLDQDRKQLDSQYEVLVKFVIRSESADDAADDLKEIIQEGILTYLNDNDRENIVCEYDIEDIEPAEVS